MLINKLTIAADDVQYDIAYQHIKPQNSQAAILWLSGYCSVMNATKANALAAWAEEHSVEMIRFDYSGLGESDGDLSDATVSKWLNEALLIHQQLEKQPTIIVGSSFGGWLALRLVETLMQSQLTQPKALLLLAPAADFTHELLLKQLPDDLIAHLDTHGKLILPSQYDSSSYIFYKNFVHDAKQHLLFNRPANVDVPMTIIHGELDLDVPISISHKLLTHFKNSSLITIKDAQHRLSREQDLNIILKTLTQMI